MHIITKKKKVFLTLFVEKRRFENVYCNFAGKRNVKFYDALYTQLDGSKN